MSPTIAIFQSRLLRNCAMVAAGCLFKAGVVLGMPMPSTAPSGTVTFLGAIVTGTCAPPAAGDMASAQVSESVRSECHSGENLTGYRFTANEVGDRPNVRLLKYAKDSYGKAMVLTYVYD